MCPVFFNSLLFKKHFRIHIIKCIERINNKQNINNSIRGNVSRLLVYIHYKYQKCFTLSPKEASTIQCEFHSSCSPLVLFLLSFTVLSPWHCEIFLSPHLKRNHCSNDRVYVISFYGLIKPQQLFDGGHDCIEMIWALQSVCQALLCHRRAWLPSTKKEIAARVNISQRMKLSHCL